ncbi:efflux RND transporter periplasmic adaptor subunit [Flaviaesturariibacter aridisoli]|uniref:HlyD family efflux transporter periplasmic adaptor subunit n=1 Tax=Flaviaesturariibacter aridisoli TaxID=2545761 RepID=A0A4R4DX06_9BACT|nr:efflux RND transporter periplasmic adaptor subunit [Flaviaesturariibacter aridisoli]TCZ66938.1 HlyD family efflux transporter periplasmic adaptor subunit [Flaviaesturariibacter aridisoli]
MKKCACLISATLLLAACGSNTEKIYPESGPITEAVYASGAVRSRDQYEVHATVSGTIRQLYVTEGDLVRAGQPLLTLQQEAPRLSAESAELNAQYSSEARNADRLAALRATVDQSKARFDNDATLYQRQQQLWKEGIGTRNELDARALAFRTSRDAWRAAQLQYSDAQRQVAQVAALARKNASVARAQLGDFTVRSSLNGRVYSVLRKQGELVGPQVPIAIIGAGDDFLLELQVDEYDIAKVQLGQPVVVTMDSYRGQAFDARLSKIDPIMNERTRSFLVEAQFTKRPERLYPNLTVEANIVLQTKPQALTIPRSYLVDDGHVLLADKKKRAVKTGLRDYQRVEILSGLGKDEAIIKPAP